MQLMRTTFHAWQRLILGIFLGFFCLNAHAHQPGVSYLQLTYETNRVSGVLDMALGDLEFSVGLDTDKNGAVTYQELLDHQPAIGAYVRKNLKFSDGGKPVDMEIDSHEVASDNEGVFSRVLFHFVAEPSLTAVEVHSSLFTDKDAMHRCLAQLLVNGTPQVAVLRNEEPAHRFDLLQSGAPAPGHFRDFVREGIWHIWKGYDHILFLISLLLPAVLIRQEGKWIPCPAMRPAVINILKIVTAFTVAHSITLSLAALELVSLPSRFVESMIAVSVILAAANNLKPYFQGKGWLVAFCFGIIHGFGFASVLGELHLQRAQLAQALVGFNLGVEIGQIAIVTLFIPLAFAARATTAYRRLALQAGSITVIAIATLWLIERALNLGFMPF